jgi:hypothetical protein
MDDNFTWSEFNTAITNFNSSNGSGPDIRMATKAELLALLADPSINQTTLLPNVPSGWPTAVSRYWASDVESGIGHQKVSMPGGEWGGANDTNDMYPIVVLIGLGGTP